jgi:indolepyruvate ferredoxin oxidoreductase
LENVGLPGMGDHASKKAPREVLLDDKYIVQTGPIFLTGTQALVKLPMLQRNRDLQRGLNTACFISGYRGSPLGSVDRELWRAKKYLDQHHVTFSPGINEELAATSVWGSQQVGLFPGARYDGVFGLWYGKGPGLDRSCDAFRHGNGAGTSRHGGVIAVVGDDHNLKSSTQPAHCEPTFVDLNMPVLFPANVEEIIALGLLGWEMSRFSGSWVGVKVLADTMDSSATVDLDAVLPPIVHPQEEPPPGSVHIRWPDPWAHGEVRFHKFKLPAILAFARANRINRIERDVDNPRIAILASGKSWSDLQQALADLDIDEAFLRLAGVRQVKLSMPWPLDHSLVREWCTGLEEVIVLEEKRQLVEDQVRSALYNLPDSQRPRVVGHFDEVGKELLPRVGEHNADVIARALASRLSRWIPGGALRTHLERLDARQEALAILKPSTQKRAAFFCSGCPHNTSTNVPSGSRAIAGIGCHGMAMFTDRAATYTQMGGEGTNWIGQAPFVDEPHVFANLGDGTYYHSGHLAVRACVAAGVSITFKILFNDAVAMTGGQPIDGPLSVPMVVRQMRAEGVQKIIVVAEEPAKYRGADFPSGVEVRPRNELDAVQRALRLSRGVSVLVYDQVCAAEKRRRRKRRQLQDPSTRVFINRAVCEGCGDCSKTSNCVSVLPVETELGRKRKIDQSSCNKDYSCTDGFCPSFVTLEGTRRRTIVNFDLLKNSFGDIPEPRLPELGAERPYGILIAGIGGTGVVTIGSIMGMAAHIEGKACRLLDVLGMAQKGGAVLSHVKFAASRTLISSAKLNGLNADVLIAADLLVGADNGSLAILRDGARAVFNTNPAITGAHVANPDLELPWEQLEEHVNALLGRSRTHWIGASRISERVFGDSAFANMLLLGVAWQLGLIPIGRGAIDMAIRLNGVAITENRRAFLLGRAAVGCPEKLARVVLDGDDARPVVALPAATIRHHGEHLREYQNAAYEERYLTLLRRVEAAEASVGGTDGRLTSAVAESYFKLLGYKDEYEVARLYSHRDFWQSLAAEFDTPRKIRVLLAPPFMSRLNARTGSVRKRRFGPWIFVMFRLLAHVRWVRGTLLDPFAWTAERKLERQLIRDFEATLTLILAQLTPHNLSLAAEIGAAPRQIRGFGHIKAKSIREYQGKMSQLVARFRDFEDAESATAGQSSLLSHPRSCVPR